MKKEPEYLNILDFMKLEMFLNPNFQLENNEWEYKPMAELGIKKTIFCDFEGQMKAFGQEIVAIFKVSGSVKGRKAKFSEIMAFFFLHRTLTQAQLHQITGFPLSTLSSLIVDLEKTKMLTKKIIPGSNEYQYTIMHELSTFLFGTLLRSDIYMQNLAKIIQNLLDKLDMVEYRQLEGRKYLQLAFKDLLALILPVKTLNAAYAGAMKQSMADTTQKPEIFIQKSQSPKIQSFKFQESTAIARLIPDPIDPRLLEIERYFIDGFVKERGQMGSEQYMTTFLGYFYLRRELTQKQLQILTGWSAGLISTQLKKLCNIKLVVMDNQQRTLVYRMPNIAKAYLSSLTSMGTIFANMNATFRKINGELVKNQIQFKELYGFNEIQTIVQSYCRFIPLFEQWMDAFSDLLKNIV